MSFQRDSTNFLVLKKIPGMFVLRRYTRQISKLEKKKIFTCYMIWMLVENSTFTRSCIFGNYQKEVFLKTKKGRELEEVDL